MLIIRVTGKVFIGSVQFTGISNIFNPITPLISSIGIDISINENVDITLFLRLIFKNIIADKMDAIIDVTIVIIVNSFGKRSFSITTINDCMVA